MGTKSVMRWALGLALPFILAVAGASAAPKTYKASYVPGEVLVKYRSNATKNDKAATRQIVMGQAIGRFTDPALTRLRLEALSVDEAVKRLRRHPQVEIAEPNFIYQLAREVNDPIYPDQWGFKNRGPFPFWPSDCVAGVDTDANRAWNLFTGSRDVIVGVIDNGVQIDHEDLVENIWVNPGEVPNNGYDDDQNGYVDDVNGWDFYDNDNDPRHDVTTGTARGHGTHVAGTIGAATHNGLGGAGMNWEVSLMPLRSGEGDSIRLSDALDALDYAIAMGADIVNNSWGGDDFSDLLLNKMQEASDAGILLVNAAGNDGRDIDVDPFYPASYDLPLSVAVANLRCNGSLYSGGLGSNYGVESVDIAAPGFYIWSTRFPELYDQTTGTSMAAPHVAGALALLMGYFTDDTPAQILDRLLDNADTRASLSGLVAGSRSLDVFAAMSEPDSTPPADTTDLQILETASNWIRLGWVAPGDDGVNGRAGVYDIRVSTQPITAANFDAAQELDNEPWPEDAGSVQEMKVTGLSTSQTYYFALKTMDEYELPGNTSGLSNVVSSTTLPAPTVAVVPTSLEVTVDKGFVASEKFTVSNAGVGVLDFSVAPVAGDDFLAVASNGSGSLAAGVSKNPRVVMSSASYDCGQVSGQFMVASNDPANPQVKVDVQMNVAGPGDVALPGGDLLSFGSVVIGGKYYASITIENQGCDTLYLLGMNSDDAEFRILNRPKKISPESSVDIWVEFSAGTLGAARGDLTFQTDDPDEQFSTVIAIANVVTPPDVSFSPGSFSATAFAGDAASVLLSITNSGGAPSGYWAQEQSGSSWLRIESNFGSIPPGQTVELPVKFSADGLCDGVYTDAILLLTHDPDEPESLLPVTFTVTPAPDIRVDPDNYLLFGSVQGPAIETVTIYNQGCLPLTVTGMSSDNPVFSVNFKHAVTIPPGGTYSNDVLFQAGGGSSHQGTLTITSNDPDEAVWSLTMVGDYAP